MRVLVTGATGFIGTHVARALASSGHQVRALVRTPAKLETVTARAGVDIDALEVVNGDITDAAAVAEAVDGCDAVVHAAAVVGVDPSRAAEIDSVNFAGASNVLGAAADAGCDPIVHVSTAMALFPFTADPVTPDHPVGKPRYPYARSKARCETLARSLQDDGRPVVIVYPALVIGPDDYGGSTQVKPMQLWLSRPFPRAKGYSMSFIDVRDIAAVVAAAMVPDRGPKRYVMFGHCLDAAEHLEALSRVTGRSLRSVSVPKAAFRVLGAIGDLVSRLGREPMVTSEGVDYMFGFSAGDNSGAEADTGVRLRPVDESLRDTIAWMHREGHLTDAQAGVLAAGSDEAVTGGT